ncbi:TPA: hypothetical protein ACF33V_003500 [Vibrio parahaemolyticus]|nr:hypothetical protein [Vibrio fluvialis]
MIHNWTVITQPVRYGSKGIAYRERYLTSRKHPNHKNTCDIKEVIGNEKTARYIALIGEQYRLRQQMSGKAGRHLSSYAMEYCLTLPKGVCPTNKQWLEIVSFCCKSLQKICSITNEQEHTFNKNIRAVLHRQDQAITSGSGDHVHLIVGKILAGDSSRVLTELQQKKATKALKSAFNFAILKYVGLNHFEYTPSQLNKTKKLEIWKYHRNKEVENSENLRRIQEQIDKWFTAFKERDIRQLNRQFNRISKSYKIISSDIGINKESMDNLSHTLSEIENLSGKKIII